MTYSSKLKKRPRSSSRSYASAASRRPTAAAGGRSAWLILACLLLLVLAVAWRWYEGRNSAQPDTANLSVLSGQATVARGDAATELPLAAGRSASLQRGDTVQTTADGSAKLTLSGGETIELQGATRLSVLELHREPVTRALVVVFALHEGKTLSRVRHGIFQGMRYEIEMNTATVKASGTAFRCDALANDHAYVLVYDGAVDVSMGQQAVTLQPGQALDIWLGQTLTPTDTGLAIPGGPPEPTEAVVAGTATYTEREKTLFVPATTPTRPGDQPATPAGGELYTVQKGDTLYSIARKFGLSWEDVWNANKDVLPRPELIRAGQVLRIPR